MEQHGYKIDQDKLKAKIEEVEAKTEALVFKMRKRSKSILPTHDQT